MSSGSLPRGPQVLAMSEPTPVALEKICADTSAWPRSSLDQVRVAEFVGLYRDDGLGALPALDVVSTGDGYLLADGWHRLNALRALRVQEALVRLIDPAGLPPDEAAWRHGLITAATAARPLSRAERRTAVDRLLGNSSSLSDREIARLVGVSPTTVGAHRRRLGGETSAPGAGEQLGSQYVAAVTADELAYRLSRSLHRLYEERGLSDWFLGDRTGKRLAAALVDLHGPDDALAWAGRLQGWATVAVAELSG
jgi:hypothetical protein